MEINICTTNVCNSHLRLLLTSCYQLHNAQNLLVLLRLADFLHASIWTSLFIVILLKMRFSSTRKIHFCGYRMCWYSSKTCTCSHASQGNTPGYKESQFLHHMNTNAYGTSLIRISRFILSSTWEGVLFDHFEYL